MDGTYYIEAVEELVPHSWDATDVLTISRISFLTFTTTLLLKIFLDTPLKFTSQVNHHLLLSVLWQPLSYYDPVATGRPSYWCIYHCMPCLRILPVFIFKLRKDL